MAENKKNPLSPGIALPLAMAGVAFLLLAIYWQTGEFPFVHLDDEEYVTRNARVLSGLTAENLGWSFVTFHFANWHPLTWISHMASVSLFGLHAGAHHLGNVAIHLLNAELLLLALWRMTGSVWRSALAAALFAVHPLNVESVAWVSERKGLLCGLFWILSAWGYAAYVRDRRPWRYLLVALGFGGALLSKPAAVTFPFALLLLDAWPLGRTSLSPPADGSAWNPEPPLRLLLEKTPLMALSAASCFITFLAQSEWGAVSPPLAVPPGERLANAVVSCATYLVKTVWPSSLAVYYPHPASLGVSIPAWEILATTALVGGMSALAVRFARAFPPFAVGWFWFLGALVPTLGLVQVGSQAMADRYAYIPLAGLFVAFAWRLPDPDAGGDGKRSLAWGAAGAAVLALSAAAWHQVGFWRSGVDLYSRVLAVTRANFASVMNMGTAYERAGRPAEAVPFFREAVRLRGNDARAWGNLGMALARTGRLPEAADSLREALRIRPADPEILNGLGVAHDLAGRTGQAVECYREAVRLRPDLSEGWFNLGLAYGKLGRPREAVAAFSAARALRPLDAATWYFLGVAWADLGESREAARSFREALRLRPGYPEAERELRALREPNPSSRQMPK